MSFFDKLVAAVTPPESDEDRMEARRKALAQTTPGDWLSQVIDHHEQIERAFADVKRAVSGSERSHFLNILAGLLTGHANAEEATVYPLMADDGHKSHTGLAYEEQAMTKIQMALLEKLDPMSQDFDDKLEHIRGAVTHHMYQEESDWFVELKRDAPGSDQAKMDQRYREEIERYEGSTTS